MENSTFFKVLVMMLYIILTNVVTSFAFGLISAQSDVSFYTGIGLLFAYTVASYIFLRWLFRYRLRKPYR